ncbi:MAG: DegV family protein [Clostridiales bacterium]|nr:DegV family protein [Clostridiales bacterium]
MTVKISADSTCDLPQALIRQYDIGIVPLYIVNEAGAFRDGVEITPQDIFETAGRTGALPSTSAVPAADYYAYWSQWLKTCDAIVHVSLSSELSCSWHNACLAAKELGNVWVVDSRSLCAGSGLLAVEGAELAEAGVEPAAIAQQLQQRTEKLDVSFVLDTLSYLRKGGRCSALTALGANLLSIKPSIEVHDGVMDVGKKFRGKIDRIYIQYACERLEGRDDIDLRRIFIADSGISDEMRAELEQAVLACQPFEQVYHNVAGCTISTHCGPNCMGLMFLRK